MNKIIRLFSLFLSLLLSVSSFAQTPTEPAPDFMHSNGKIYVVVLVVVVILSGLFIYLINLDRKITRLEKD